MPDTRVEEFAPAWLDTAAGLFVAVFNAPPWNDGWTLETARTRLAELLATPGFAGVVIVEAAELLGFAVGNAAQWHTGRHFMLREMCVHPDHRRRGLGRSLITALEVRLPDVEQLYLLTDRDGPAATFYERQGFRPARRQAVMTKRLRAE